ncbi:unnamed protein product, partial [Closterium sp. NIES-54]
MSEVFETMYFDNSSTAGRVAMCAPSAYEGLCVGAAATAGPVPALVAGTGLTSATMPLSFTLDSRASSCFFRDCTNLTPLRTPVTVALADPTVGPVAAHYTTTLPYLAAPSGVLTGYYTPSFSRNLVGISHVHDLRVVTTFSLDEPVASCTDGATGAPPATFHWEPGSGLYSLHTESHHTGSDQVRSGSCCVVRLSVSQTRSPRFPVHSLCLEGRQRTAPHSSSFSPTTAPLETLHLDIWGPSSVLGPRQEHYFMIVVDDYSRYTTDFPLQRKADVPIVLKPWLLARDGAQGICGLRLHSDRGVRYAAHQLNLWPSDAWPRVTPDFLWTGSQGLATDYRVWDSLAHVRAPGANKLLARTRACVFLGFLLNSVTFQFFSSQYVTFDESDCYYRSHPHRGSEAFSPSL